jgi:hypothetical protein
LTVRLTIVVVPSVPEPLKPTSQVWPVLIGWYWSQVGSVAV